VGKFITWLRPGDSALQDQIFAEAHRLYATGTPLSEAIKRLLEMAGDNPNVFRVITKRNTQGLNRTAEGQAVLRLIAIASIERDESHRTGVPLTLGRHSTDEKALAAMPVADAFQLLAKEEPRLLVAEADARRLADNHSHDVDDGAALEEALGRLIVQVVMSDGLVGKKGDNPGSILATQPAVFVVAEHLAISAGTDPNRRRAGNWWPAGD
jgi:hypothetical protein